MYIPTSVLLWFPFIACHCRENNIKHAVLLMDIQPLIYQYSNVNPYVIDSKTFYYQKKNLFRCVDKIHLSKNIANCFRKFKNQFTCMRFNRMEQNFVRVVYRSLIRLFVYQT